MRYPAQFFKDVDSAKSEEEVMAIIKKAGFGANGENTSLMEEFETLKGEGEVLLTTMLGHALCKMNTMLP